MNNSLCEMIWNEEAHTLQVAEGRLGTHRIVSRLAKMINH
jgi:hypothetical protein